MYGTLAFWAARRVVFFTAGAYTPKVVAFLERVPNLQIGKPIDLDTLVQIVHEMTGIE